MLRDGESGQGAIRALRIRQMAARQIELGLPIRALGFVRRRDRCQRAPRFVRAHFHAGESPAEKESTIDSTKQVKTIGSHGILPN